ncbi:MAG: hypothetical protein JWO47_1071 [Candidatus Saccharibacteria bacterium]|nr:hypothetical protein [Candidatus Saccharibacteria bacterium]
MNPQAPTPGNPQQQVIERLKTAVNVLVTVSNSPSVDQLSAAVGFTLALNKMGKHATAVYSGDTPSTIEFLTPAATIEKNTDSLRDFIVSLDKSKADKLRYKVEDNVVKIFITPFRTSLTENDLDFSQGDFNVDAVVALGVAEREQLDQAIIAHGRILHDATVITVSAGETNSSLGAINWQDPSASSLSEMLVGLDEALQPGTLDNQIATAYLTGIVSQTERFRNNKTTPKIMTMSAQLMAAGANQQLIASSLEQVIEVPVSAEVPEESKDEKPAENPDGSLTIEHEAEETPAPPEEPTPPAEEHDISQESGLNLDIEVKPDDTEDENQTEQIDIDEHGNLTPAEAKKASGPTRRLLTEQPEGKDGSETDPSYIETPHLLTGLTTDDGENEPNSDPLSGKSTIAPAEQPLLDHNKDTDDAAATPEPAAPVNSVSTLPPLPDSAAASTAPAATVPDNVQTLPPFFDDNTLRDIEKTFDSTHIVEDPHSTINEIEEVKHSPHLAQEQGVVVDSARDAVSSAINAAPYDTNRPQPLQALNAAPLIDPVLPQAPSTDPVLAGLGLTDQPTPSPSITQATHDPVPDETLESEHTTVDPTGQTPPPVPPPLLPLQ